MRLELCRKELCEAGVMWGWSYVRLELCEVGVM